jgi:hypothetical protein
MEEFKYLIEGKQLKKFCQRCPSRSFQCRRTCPLFIFINSIELAKAKNIPFGEAVKLMTRKDNSNVKRTEEIFK